MSSEVLDHMRTFRQGIVSSHSINDFLAENGPTPMIVEVMQGTAEVYKTTIDWTMLSMIKGLVYGLYMEMKHDGAQLIANEILMQEGLPQYISKQNQEYLDNFDKKHHLTLGILGDNIS